MGRLGCKVWSDETGYLFRDGGAQCPLGQEPLLFCDQHFITILTKSRAKVHAGWGGQESKNFHGS